MHYQAIVTVAYGHELIDRNASKPVLGYLVIIGLNCSSIGQAADLACEEALRQHDGDAALINLQEVVLTAIEKDDWDSEVLSQVESGKMEELGVYYRSNRILLDTLEMQDE